MKNKFVRSLAISLAVVSMLAIQAAAVTVGGGTVNATSLNLRAEASVSAPSKELIPGGSFLLIEEKNADWYKVLFDGEEGYVSSGYVNFAETLDGSYGSGVVTGDYVRMRGTPSTDGDILSYFNTGSKLVVSGVSGAWLKVSAPNGTVGYIRSDYITCTADGEAAASVQTSLGEQIVESAKQYIGTRYVWGGMSTSGFDCSGFVNYVYKLYGYTMNRTAQNIYSYDGTSVSKDQLQPGDLIFFGYSGSSVSHVGMYIGNGQLIHASSSAAQVTISDLSESYYTRMYVGAKRIVG